MAVDGRREEMDESPTEGAAIEVASHNELTENTVIVVPSGTPTCYVCFEPIQGPEQVELCLCKDRWLHLECQRKMVQATTRCAKCPVCQTVYTNATTRRGKLRFSSHAKWVLVIIILGLALTGLGIHQLSFAVYPMAIGSGIAFLLLVTLVAGLLRWFCCCDGGEPLVRRETVVVLVGDGSTKSTQKRCSCTRGLGMADGSCQTSPTISASEPPGEERI